MLTSLRCRCRHASRCHADITPITLLRRHAFSAFRYDADTTLIRYAAALRMIFTLRLRHAYAITLRCHAYAALLPLSPDMIRVSLDSGRMLPRFRLHAAAAATLMLRRHWIHTLPLAGQRC